MYIYIYVCTCVTDQKASLSGEDTLSPQRGHKRLRDDSHVEMHPRWKLCLPPSDLELTCSFLA